MTSSKAIYWVLAFAAGAALSFEIAIGGILGKNIGQLETSLFIFIAGTAVFLPMVLIKRRQSLTLLKDLKKWELCGGFLGGTYIILLLVCVTKVGVGASMTAVIIGQLTMGAVMEHFGWINLPVTKFNPGTLLAFVFLIAALFLII